MSEDDLVLFLLLLKRFQRIRVEVTAVTEEDKAAAAILVRKVAKLVSADK